ncbi:MAG: BatA domain-containing protein [Longimicrobiales bacterium]
MGLLHPGLLLLGLGIAVPLFLHLLQRHQGPRVMFPALRYLRRAERESARRIKLRQILLMLLRMLAVLLVTFAAARPFMRVGGVRHEPTAVVIILDNSLSSGAVISDAQVLDALKARALETLAAGESEDRFWLLRAGASQEPAYPGDALETARRVRETLATDAAADLPQSIVRARAILASGAGGRATEIQLLSDLQETNFATSITGRATDPALVVWRDDHDTPANRSIADVSVGGGIAPGANERGSVNVTIGGTAQDTVSVRLMIDGRLAAASRAGTGSTAVLAMPARAPGIMSGWIEVDADAVRADNRRYFATRVAEPPRVALTRPVAFVDEALAALETAGRIRRAGGGQADVLLAPGAEGVLQSARTVVILPPESPLEIDAVNRRLALSGIPWSYALQESPGEARFEMRDSTDAVLRTLESARMRNVFALRAAPRSAGDTALLRLRDGAPWAVRGQRQTGGRYILLATPFSENASNIPTSAAMLPLLDRIIRSWSAGANGTEEASPGVAIALPAGTSAVQRPDSVREPVTGTSYTTPAIAGVYQIMKGDQVTDAFAVNAPAIESDLTRVSEKSLRTRLASWNIETSKNADEWRRDVYRQRLGSELWRPLLLALLIVLAIETVVAATGGKRRSMMTPSAIVQEDAL